MKAKQQVQVKQTTEAADSKGSKVASFVASSVGSWLSKAKDSAKSVKDQASQRILSEEFKEKISTGLVNSSGFV